MSENENSTSLVSSDSEHSVERLVYITLKSQFSGQFCRLRKAKKVRAHIHGCRDNVWVKLLLQKYGIENVCETAKRLLRQNVFESKSKAEMYFAANGKRIQWEGSETLARAQVQFPVKSRTTNDGCHIKSKNEPLVLSSLTRVEERTANTQQNTERERDLRHIEYISLAEQHRILRKTQKIVEGALFRYASIYMKDILSQNEWFCKEAVELNKWTRILRGQQNRFNQKSLETLPKTFNKILDSLNGLRHAAVHRLNKPLVLILSFTTDAESIIKLCEDNRRLKKLNLLLRKLKTRPV